jgi:hypothetical protein
VLELAFKAFDFLSLELDFFFCIRKVFLGDIIGFLAFIVDNILGFGEMVPLIGST